MINKGSSQTFFGAGPAAAASPMGSTQSQFNDLLKDLHSAADSAQRSRDRHNNSKRVIVPAPLEQIAESASIEKLEIAHNKQIQLNKFIAHERNGSEGALNSSR